ncbi:30S ribosomal protein S18 [Candidatus Roizmanbacteria bacterium RIFCSPHIGHO2_12_FULL_41_11]|uniref:Small ribosomal subunit protein bS18 n=2 Tax=Candidatus Roizmaniibacteriota TaxID=1752723 RepID=A0A1F7J9V4_9BACT|nr:MAG: 30S ribosomal protein S18 [Candidatus Roizmanbacteria bacterium RIFCSPHIGHO2_12_FULL_41_11]OGK52391.1 MAG: 30S ribosomal protein S18 [Candidatus Roizmanbacteria bacterium RIFCSPLOWO2_01_FULL_41_22]
MAKCFYCKYKLTPDYKDTENLSKFLTSRMKIVGREKSGVCAKHQRGLTKHIKYARYLALIPYTSYQGLR